jgi:hypothetical protein
MGPVRWEWALVLMAHMAVAAYLRLVAQMSMSFNLASEAPPVTSLHQYRAFSVKP